MKQNFAREKYKFIDHTADIGVEIFGDDLPSLFANAGYALFDIITDLSLVREKGPQNININGRNLDEMMVNWLGEFLYVFDTERFLVKKINIKRLETSFFTSTSGINTSVQGKMSDEGEYGNLQAEIWGEKYDAHVHVINTTIKAATYHKLEVVKENNVWHCRVILDV